MEKEERGKESEKDSPPLQIDPKCIQDALRAFFRPTKHGDPRLDFYAMYEKGSTEHDFGLVKKFDADFNTALVFAGLSSAVSSAFIIAVHPKLEPDPNEQSAHLLRAILFTLNQSAITNEAFPVPPVREHPSRGVTIAITLLYASLLLSLLVAFVVIMGKQWTNRYLRRLGGSTVEKCGDRQRKCDGLGEFRFDHFVSNLSGMLQTAVVLLVFGLCQYVWIINSSIGGVLIGLAIVGHLFYFYIVFLGVSSYEFPLQTPGSIVMRKFMLWIDLHMAARFLSTAATAAAFYKHFLWLLKTRIWHSSRNSFLPIIHPSPQQPTASITPQTPLRQTISDTALAALQKMNTIDVRCTSWILSMAIRFAGTILWFRRKLDAKPPHDLIISLLMTCFDSTRELYLGLRDRAYCSVQAILWIHVCAMGVPEEFAQNFPLPSIRRCVSYDVDFRSLLRMYDIVQSSEVSAY